MLMVDGVLYVLVRNAGNCAARLVQRPRPDLDLERLEVHDEFRLPDVPQLRPELRGARDYADVAPDEIDYIVGHGPPPSSTTSPRPGRSRQPTATHAYKVAISSPKSMIGHLVGAAGIASVLAAVGAIRDRVIPPTANLHTPDPECDLDYVPLPRVRRSRYVAVNGFGFGGQNAVAISAGWPTDVPRAGPPSKASIAATNARPGRPALVA